MTAGISIYLWGEILFFEKNKLVHFLVQRGRTICRKERDGVWVSSTKEIQRKLYDLAFFRFFFLQQMHLLHCVTGYFGAVRRY